MLRLAQQQAAASWVVRGVAMTYSEVCCGVSGSGPEFVLLYCVTTASLLQLHQYNVSHSFSKRVSLPILGHVHMWLY